MEEYKDLIVLILVVAFSVLGSLSKKKKQAKKQPVHPQQEESPWPEETEYRPQVRETRSTPPVPDAFFTEKAIASTHRPHRQEEHDEKIMLNTNSPRQGTSAGYGEEDTLQDFDLRKAVIYSEILKPKFKEY